MERINEEDVDVYLQQTERVFATPPERDKRQEEWRHFDGYALWIPDAFCPTGREAAEEIFWSENLPDRLFLTEGNTAGITLQKMKGVDTADPIGDIRMLLEKLDDRTVCYGMGEEEGRIKVHWLEYKSFAADGRVYNVLFVFQAGQDWILGTFYCPFEEYGQWQPTVWEILRTIREEQNEGI